MKQLYLTLTFLLPFIGNAVQAQTGMKVFADCYASDTALIGFFGDELTLKDDVKGEGTLVMTGGKPQAIASQNGSVEHLLVTNPTVVQTKGRLTVYQSLIIRKGELIVLPLAQLHTYPTATVLLSPAANLLTDRLVWPKTADETVSRKQVANQPNLILTALSAGWDHSLLTPQTTRLSPEERIYRSPPLQTLGTPPRWA